MKTKISALGQYNKQGTDKKGNIVFSIKFTYDEREALAQMVVLPGQTIKLSAKYGESKPVKLGEFDYESLKIDRDGQGELILKTEYDSFEMGNLQYLFPLDDGTIKLVTFTLDLDIEDESEDEPDEVEENWEDDDDDGDWDE